MLRILFLLTVMTVPFGAFARTCQVPPSDLVALDQKYGTIDTMRCLIAEINDLRAEQARLRTKIESLERSFGNLPGEFSNTDGKISRPASGKIGSAVFKLTARQGRQPSSLAIDQSVLSTVCGKGGGCSLSIVLESDGFRLGEAGDTITVGPCALTYNTTTGAWSVGAGCGADTAISGKDGEGAPGGGGGAEIVASAGKGCVLSDAEPARSIGGGADIFAADNSRGLFLVAAPSLRDGAAGRFRCSMKID